MFKKIGNTSHNQPPPGKDTQKTRKPLFPNWKKIDLAQPKSSQKAKKWEEYIHKVKSVCGKLHKAETQGVINARETFGFMTKSGGLR